MKKLKIAGFVMLSGLFLFACKEGSVENKTLNGYVTFSKGDVQVNQAKARVGLKINQNDKVVTGKKSAVIIQFAQGALIAIKANTSVDIQKLAMSGLKPDVAIRQNTGSTFHKIAKGRANYSVATPTAVAGVRGTAFDLTIDKKQTRVSLLHGKLAVENSQTKEKKTIEKETAISVDAKEISKPEGLSTKVEKELKALDEIPFDQNVVEAQKTLGEQKENIAEKLNVEAITVPKVALQNITDNVKNEPKSLVGLKKKYGVLYQIATKDGRVFIGALKKSGSKFIVITPKKTEVLRNSDILKKNKITGPF